MNIANILLYPIFLVFFISITLLIPIISLLYLLVSIITLFIHWIILQVKENINVCNKSRSRTSD